MTAATELVQSQDVWLGFGLGVLFQSLVCVLAMVAIAFSEPRRPRR